MRETSHRRGSLLCFNISFLETRLLKRVLIFSLIGTKQSSLRSIHSIFTFTDQNGLFCGTLEPKAVFSFHSYLLPSRKISDVVWDVTRTSQGSLLAVTLHYLGLLKHLTKNGQGHVNASCLHRPRPRLDGDCIVSHIRQRIPICTQLRARKVW